jgi:hypothetical protein
MDYFCVFVAEVTMSMIRGYTNTQTDEGECMSYAVQMGSGVMIMPQYVRKVFKENFELNMYQVLFEI